MRGLLCGPRLPQVVKAQPGQEDQASDGGEDPVVSVGETRHSRIYLSCDSRRRSTSAFSSRRTQSDTVESQIPAAHSYEAFSDSRTMNRTASERLSFCFFFAMRLRVATEAETNNGSLTFCHSIAMKWQMCFHSFTRTRTAASGTSVATQFETLGFAELRLSGSLMQRRLQVGVF